MPDSPIIAAQEQIDNNPAVDYLNKLANFFYQGGYSKEQSINIVQEIVYKAMEKTLEKYPNIIKNIK